MAKLLQLMERRRHAKLVTESGEFQPKKRNPLFPNGEHDEIVAMINELRGENLERRKENVNMRIEMRATRESLQEGLSDLSTRLDRARIS